MDEKMLNSLITAYESAPSSELAKIITFSYIKIGNTNAARQYVSSLENNLSINEFQILVESLLLVDGGSDLDILSRCLDENNLLILIEELLQRKAYELAKSIYISNLNRVQEIKSSELEDRLGVKEEKAKLHVIEKPDHDEITDISHYREDTTDFNDVIGLTHIKKQIYKKIILPFHKPSLYQRFKKKIGGGVLLFGPPGCGKTLIARATAGECNASFFNIEVSDVLDMYIGESEQKLHAIFEKARNEVPAVLFFDELEALAGKRENASNSASSNTVSQFLTELDGFSQNNHGVLVLASTNVPWTIDSAFLRPGRFDRMFFVSPPDVEARSAILEHHMKGRPSVDGINFTSLASKTPGYSGADLANLVEMAADEAIDESIESEKEVNIDFEHFKLALIESRATTTEWLTTARNYARYANDGGRYNDVLDFIKKHEKK